MSKVNKIKKWLKKQMKAKKFVITTIIFFALLVAVVFGITTGFSGILGSAYDVDSIGKNIDKIKIGDSISYKANGYSDWEVLNINKEDNTIDIVSKTSVEDVTIKVEDIDNYYDILQNTANKYLDGKYAVSARSVDEEDSLHLERKLGYWINKKEQNKLYHSSGSFDVFDFSSNVFSGYLMPVVELNVGDSTSLNIGDIYNYSLNGVEEWIILYIDNSTHISVVPKTPIYFEFVYKDMSNFSSYVKQEVEKFKDNNVIKVRSISADDQDALYGKFQDFYQIYTGEVEDLSYEYWNPYGYAQVDCSYNFEYLNIYYGACEGVDTNYFNYTSAYISGFVPVVTLKYDSPEKDGNDVNGELDVGDYVKYSANGYNNWKVLNIDKKKNTVDIISGGIVKNLTLEGKDDYDNLENILQSEVDKYKVGDNVIKARNVEIDDFDSLKLMKDRLSLKFFLNNKKHYRKELNSYNIYYACAVGSYDRHIFGLKYEWAILGDTNLYNSSAEGYSPEASYSYTAGLRPIITLKLSEVEKSDDKDVAADTENSLVEEQNKANQSSQGLVSNEKLEKDEDTIEKEDILDDPVGSIEDETNKTTQEIKALNKSLEAVEEKNKQLTTIAIINMVSIIGVGAFSAFSFFSFFKRLR